MPRNNPGNLRQYRGKKLRKGYNTIRVRKKELLPGSQVLYKGETLTVRGTHLPKSAKGKKTTNVEFTKPASDGRKSADISKLKIVSHDVVPSWEPVV